MAVDHGLPVVVVVGFPGNLVDGVVDPAGGDADILAAVDLAQEIHVGGRAPQGFRGARLDAFAVSPDGSVLAIAERTGTSSGPNGTRIVLVNTSNWQVIRVFTVGRMLKKLAFVPGGTTLAAFVNFLGGRIGAYETLVERARREAILRMKEEARRMNGRYICNIKFSTANIMGQKAKQAGCVEVVAYGTVFVPRCG